MGAWGIGPFDNDGALDFLPEFADEGVSVIESAFSAVTDAADEGYIEVDLAQAAIAAAEVVAISGGQPPEGLAANVADRIFSWQEDVAGQPDLPSAAQEVLGLILAGAEKSEIFELWAETDDFDDWLALVNDLTARLEEAGK